MARTSAWVTRTGRLLMLITAVGVSGGCQMAPREASSLPGTTAEPTAAPASADLSATQALERMLDLIRASPRAADMTPDVVQRIVGVPLVQTRPHQFNYGQRLPGDWAFGVEIGQDETGRPRVDLFIDPIPETPASPTPGCVPDYERVAGELASMGFARHSWYSSHRQWRYDYFHRDGMTVYVYPRTERSSDGAVVMTCIHGIRAS